MITKYDVVTLSVKYVSVHQMVDTHSPPLEIWHVLIMYIKLEGLASSV